MAAALAATLLAPAAVPALAGVRPRAATAWQATRLPVPPGAGSGGGGYAGPIACPEVGGCVVLGEYSTAAGQDEDLIATEAGPLWSAVEAPLPPGGVEAANLGPYLLRCTGVGSCVGTSVYETSTSVAVDILEEVGGRWSAVAMPLPANASSRIPAVNAMACPHRGACVIAGSYLTTSGLDEGLLVTQEGSTFVAAEAPVIGRSNKGSALSGVACSAENSCVAAGYYVMASGGRQPLLVSDAAGALTSGAAPLPPNAAGNPEAELDGVSCGSSTLCVALGSYEDQLGGRLGFIDTSSQAGWTASTMPSPQGASLTSPSPEISGVVCKAGTYCLAVGHYTDSSDTTQGLALMERSGRWFASMMPGTADTDVVVRAVACVSATSCAAAGHYGSGGTAAGYVMTLSGATLSGEKPPAPPGASSRPREDFEYVACPWIATCVASGTYVGATTPQLPLVVSD